jgi:Putative transposase
LLAFDEEHVTFRWRDYAHGNKSRIMTLHAIEFLRRFFLHVLPQASSASGTSDCSPIASGPIDSLCRQLLDCVVSEPVLISPASASTWHCPRCGALMIILTRMTPQELCYRRPFFDSS